MGGFFSRIGVKGCVKGSNTSLVDENSLLKIEPIPVDEDTPKPPASTETTHLLETESCKTTQESVEHLPERDSNTLAENRQTKDDTEHKSFLKDTERMQYMHDKTDNTSCNSRVSDMNNHAGTVQARKPLDSTNMQTYIFPKKFDRDEMIDFLRTAYKKSLAEHNDLCRARNLFNELMATDINGQSLASHMRSTGGEISCLIPMWYSDYIKESLPTETYKALQATDTYQDFISTTRTVLTSKVPPTTNQPNVDISNIINAHGDKTVDNKDQPVDQHKLHLQLDAEPENKVCSMYTFGMLPENVCSPLVDNEKKISNSCSSNVIPEKGNFKNNISEENGKKTEDTTAATTGENTKTKRIKKKNKKPVQSVYDFVQGEHALVRCGNDTSALCQIKDPEVAEKIQKFGKFLAINVRAVLKLRYSLMQDFETLHSQSALPTENNFLGEFKVFLSTSIEAFDLCKKCVCLFNSRIELNDPLQQDELTQIRRDLDDLFRRLIPSGKYLENIMQNVVFHDEEDSESEDCVEPTKQDSKPYKSEIKYRRQGRCIVNNDWSDKLANYVQGQYDDFSIRGIKGKKGPHVNIKEIEGKKKRRHQSPVEEPLPIKTLTKRQRKQLAKRPKKKLLNETH